MKHPLAEVFGFPTTDMSAPAQRHRAKCLCPYNNKVPNCTKDKAQNPLGVCSVFSGEQVVITCPIRFRQFWLIADDAADFFFPADAKWTTLTEIRLKDADGGSAGNIDLFVELICEHIDKTPANFEIFTFAVLRVHLEKFACKIYRDTRTAAHDRGVDLSTNFGVVYQIKKLQIKTQSDADRVYAELKLNFDSERLQDGNVVLVIDDVSKEFKQFLINMRVQSISKEEVLRLARHFIEPEDRQKVLRVVSEEFGRDYLSQIT